MQGHKLVVIPVSSGRFFELVSACGLKNGGDESGIDYDIFLQKSSIMGRISPKFLEL